MGRTLRSNEHLCDLEYTARAGTLYECDCGKTFHNRLSRYSSLGAKYGEWHEIDRAEFERLTGEKARPATTAANEPRPPRGIRAWWRRQFKLDQFKERTW